MSDDNKKFSDELDDLLGDAKESVKKAADKAEEYAKKAAGKAEEYAKKASDKAVDFAKEAKGKTKEFSEEANEAFEKISGENKKVLAGITAILLGGLGVHKFVLGYHKEGIILLALTLLLNLFGLGFLGWLTGLLVWGFTIIEGLIYLTKSDEDFYNTYQIGKKPWF